VILSWRRTAGGLEVSDVEMLGGAWLRSPAAPTFDPSPAWTLSREFRPLAVARATAETVGGFEALFPNDFEGNWRDRLPLLRHAKVAEMNYAALSLRLFQAMITLTALQSTEAEQSPELMTLARAAAVFRSASGQDLQALLRGAESTLPATREALSNLSEWMLKSLTPVSALTASPLGWVFLAPPDSPDFFVSLLVREGQTGAEIERVDYVSFAGIFEALRGGNRP
jgi:hypothetical protein